MKIDSSLQPLSPASGTGKTQAPKATPATRTEGTSVEISSLSSRLKTLEDNLSATPVVNMEKVNQIKQAISEGRFRINPESISSKLIGTVQDLIQSGKTGS